MLAWFERRIDPFPSSPPERPPDRLLAFCWHYVRPMTPWLALVALLSGTIALVEVALFGFIGTLVDRLGKLEADRLWDGLGSDLSFWWAVMLVGFPVLALLYSLVYFQTILGAFPMRVRWLAHRWLLGQSLGFFSEEHSGRVSTKVMQTALAVREVVLKLIDVMLYVAVYFIGGLALMASADLRLVLPMLVWLVVYLFLMRYFLPKLQAAAELQSDTRAAMTGRVVDAYANITTVKLFAHAAREETHAKNAMSGFLDAVNVQMRLVTGVEVAIYTMNGLLLFGVSSLAIYLWSQASIGLGAITVAVGLVLRFHGMSQWVLWEVGSLFENIGTVTDGMRLLSKPRSVLDAELAPDLRVEAGGVRFESVRFHYGKGKAVIEALDLDIRPGEKVGLVGRSGAGKSTLVNLLLRFYDLEGGRILVDDQDIAKITQDSLRRQIGMVTQEPALLHRSVRDNLLYGRPEATEAELRTALARAHADEFVPDLEDGEGRKALDAHVGERGVRLSGGQRQRIALARVFLKDAPILLLDEATSALDSEVEAAIQESLYELMKGKTVIAIAHRLSTIARMDRLVLLDKGAVAETGTHDELLERGGIYANLWARQSGGFLAEDLDAAV